MKEQQDQRPQNPQSSVREEPLLHENSFSKSLHLLQLLRSGQHLSTTSHQQMLARIESDHAQLAALGKLAGRAATGSLAGIRRFALLLGQIVEPVRQRIPCERLSEQQIAYVVQNLAGTVSLPGLQILTTAAENAALLSNSSLTQAVTDTLLATAGLSSSAALLLRWEESAPAQDWSELGVLVDRFIKTPNPMDPDAPVGDLLGNLLRLLLPLPHLFSKDFIPSA